MAKSNWSWTNISVITGLFVVAVTSGGSFYESRAKCLDNTQAITELRHEHESCEKANVARWERLNEALTGMQVRTARSEEKLDLLLTITREQRKE